MLQGSENPDLRAAERRPAPVLFRLRRASSSSAAMASCSAADMVSVLPGAAPPSADRVSRQANFHVTDPRYRPNAICAGKAATVRRRPEVLLCSCRYILTPTRVR